jgi:hypothetical protein
MKSVATHWQPRDGNLTESKAMNDLPILVHANARERDVTAAT